MLLTDYDRIERAIEFIDDNYLDQPTLDDVASAVNLSPAHFQRMFKRWAGISPKRFLQYLTIGHAKALLESRQSLLETAYDAGLSGVGRLHDLFVAIDAVTPGEFKARGAGLRIEYGFHPSPFGECLIAETARGVCGLSFVADGGREAALAELRETWSGAELIESREATASAARAIFGGAADRERPLTLLLNGTNFQIKVWEALLRIPPGGVATYEDVAAAVGSPSAVRAVGRAIGRNNLAFLIPCHRVIRKTGAFGGYRWGVDRKRAMLAWEGARAVHV